MAADSQGKPSDIPRQTPPPSDSGNQKRADEFSNLRQQGMMDGQRFHKEVQNRESGNFEPEKRIGQKRADLYADQGGQIFIEELKNSNLDKMAQHGTLDKNVGSHNHQLTRYEDGTRAMIVGSRPETEVIGAMHYSKAPATEGVREEVEIKTAFKYDHQTFFDKGTDPAESALMQLPPNERSWSAIPDIESVKLRPGAEYANAREWARTLSKNNE